MAISWESILHTETLKSESNIGEPTHSIEYLLRLPLYEFGNRNLAFEIYSEILQSTVWLCSNKEMVKQIREDVPGAVCYSARELRKLLILNLKEEDLKHLNELKETFPDSSIVETKNNRGANTNG